MLPRPDLGDSVSYGLVDLQVLGYGFEETVSYHGDSKHTLTLQWWIHHGLLNVDNQGNLVMTWPSPDYPDVNKLFRAGTILERAGVDRRFTALAVHLHSIFRNEIYGVFGSPEKIVGKSSFIKCANLAMFERVSAEQRVQLVRHDVNLTELNGMLDADVPFNLALETFPAWPILAAHA